MTCRNFNQTKTLASLVRLALLITLLAAMVAFMGAGVTPTQANALTPAPGASTPLNAPAMLQFTSGGHILGFQAGSVYLAGLDHVLSVQFVGARRVMPQAGATPAQSSLKAGPLKTGAPPLSRVTYANLWPGISLTYEAQAGSLAKSTYQVAPGADPGQIHLRYNTPVTLQPDGSLSFAFASGRLTEAAPVAWQEIGGRRVPVAVAFSARGRSEIGFALGSYNPHYPLIIDPTYQWHTFYGSSSGDAGYGIAVDGSGNLYVTGLSQATWNGPDATAPLNAHSGNYDIVVVKLDSSGAYQWHTFYGSSSGDYGDSGEGIAVDGSGNLYVIGRSDATWNGPGNTAPLNAHSGENDIVVVKLNSSGTYLWHTFYGSSSWDYSRGIAMDGSGHLYVTGYSKATWNGPGDTAPLNAHSGDLDLVALKLNSSGAYLWHTFYGSSSSDAGESIAVDGSGNLYVTGWSDATWNGPGDTAPLHAHSGASDIVALKLNSNGTYLWHTFYGSSNTDGDSGIVVAGSGHLYVTGTSTATWNGPGDTAPLHAHSGYYDIVALKLDSSGAYQWHTFYGSSSYDDGYGIAVDESDNLYVTGWSEATWNGPGNTPPLHAHSGSDDIMVVKLNSSGTYQWHTFYGSSTYDRGRGIAVDGSGNLYVTGHSYATWNGPGDTPPLHAHSGSSDIVVVKTTPGQPEMAVLGNNLEIANGSSSPSTTNQTDFGQANVPGGTVTGTFTISNSGSADLNLTGIPAVTLTGPGVAHFSLTQPPTSPVGPGNTTPFEVQFAPTTTGLHTATVSMANNDSNENPYTFVIQGTGTAVPEPEMAVLGNNLEIANGSTTPSTANQTDFGQTNVPGGTVSRTFTISNSGVADLTLTGIPAVTLTGPGAAHFSLTQPPASPVGPGHTTTFEVRFAPTATGLHTATVSIANNDSDENPYTFVIQGTGEATPEPEPEMAVLGNDLEIANGSTTPSTANQTDFGQANVPGGTVTGTFTISNSGSADLNLTGIPAVTLMTGPGVAHFSLTQPPTSLVGPGNTTPFEVQFAPTTTGLHTATVSIANNDSDENPYTFVIQGESVYGIYLPLIFKN